MPKENQAELFIRMLVEILELDRISKKLGLAPPSQAYARNFNRVCVLDYDHEMASVEPLDCVQLMHHPIRHRHVALRQHRY